MAEETSDGYPTTDGNASIDDKQDIPPPPYRAVTDSSASPRNMEKKNLSSTNGDKSSLKTVSVETPTDDSSTSSTSKRRCREPVLYVITALVLGAGLISALVYFILLHVNQTDPDPAKSMARDSADYPNVGNTQVCCFNPCLNSGVCVESNITNAVPFTCECTDTYEGIICEQRKFVDMCVANPCQNGGSCTNIDTKPYYSCICPPIFIGATCGEAAVFQGSVHTGIHLPQCGPTTCKNGATCEIKRMVLTCYCADGYTGDWCETKE